MIDNQIDIDLYNVVKSESDRLVMSFSCGADSIAMFLRVLESEQFDMSNGAYFYYWFLPEVPWIEEWISYFESLYNIKIIQLPNPIFVLDQATAFLKKPITVMATAELQKTQHKYMKNDKGFLERAVKVNQGIPTKAYTAIGIKQGDSAIRRITLRKNGPLNTKKRKWYPIHDFENGDVIDIIKRHGVKAPYDYDLFGISFENLDYRFSKPIKDNCPKTYEIMKRWYPLIDMYIARNEHYHPEWNPKKGVFWRKLDVLQPEAEI